jgi:hypothetical protein
MKSSNGSSAKAYYPCADCIVIISKNRANLGYSLADTPNPCRSPGDLSRRLPGHLMTFPVNCLRAARLLCLGFLLNPRPRGIRGFFHYIAEILRFRSAFRINFRPIFSHHNQMLSASADISGIMQ